MTSSKCNRICCFLFYDKGVSIFASMKSFDQTFSKVCWVEGQRPPRAPQSTKSSHSAFSFGSFSFAPAVSKEKRRMRLYMITNRLPFFIMTPHQKQFR